MISSAHRLVRWLETYAALPLASAALALVAFHFLRAFDPSRDEFEGAMLMVSNRGAIASPDWLRGPIYTVTPYGPLYPALAGLVGAVGSWPVALAPGRLVSIMAGCVIAALIGVVVARRAGASAPGIAASMLFLGDPGVAFWLHDYRVDALAVMFAVGAYIASGLGFRGLILSAAAVAAGSIVKQTVALAAIPVAIYLWRMERRAMVYIAMVGAFCVALWVPLAVASGGYYLTVGIVGNRRLFFPAQAIKVTAEFVRNPTTIAALIALATAWVRDPSAVMRSRFVAAFVCTCICAAGLSGAEGATNNYFIEPTALAAMMVGVYGLAALWHASPSRTAILFWVLGVGVTVGITAAVVAAARNSSPALDLVRFRTTLATPAVLVDSRHIAAAIRSGLAPVVSDPFFFRIAVRNNVVDVERLERNIRGGQVSGLVLSSPLGGPRNAPEWPTPIGAMLKSRYTFWGHSGGAWLYRLKAE